MKNIEAVKKKGRGKQLNPQDIAYHKNIGRKKVIKAIEGRDNFSGRKIIVPIGSILLEKRTNKYTTLYTFSVNRDIVELSLKLEDSDFLIAN